MMKTLGTPSWIGRACVSALLVAAMLPIALDGGLSGRTADAELIQNFTPPVFTTNTAGAIDTIGNALLTCDTPASPSANCQQTLAGTRNSGNGSFIMRYLDADDGLLPATASNQTTQSSSRAVLAAPAGSTVLFAGLYWSAQSTSGTRNRIQFLAPGDTNYTQLTGSIANAGNLYQGFVDVTARVQAGGNGDYWAGDVQANGNLRNQYAAWSMVVVYENPALPVRNLSVFDGFGRVTSSFRQLDVPISGFLTPPFGPVNAEIGVVAYEGDRNIAGDQVRIDATGSGNYVNLSDASNPTTNFGNGSITDAGAADTSGTPAAINNLSVDIDEFATTNVLDNAQTSSTVRFQTQGDWWYPGVLTVAIDLFVPEFPNVTKTVTDVNGGDALPGDQLEYSMTINNVGNDGALGAVLRDPIPANTTFVPGSIQVVNGNGSFVGNEIVAPIGDGAGTPATGGALLPGESATVTFRVTIDEAARNTTIANTATVDYRAQTLGDAFSFVTNEVLTPVPPLADLVVTKSASPSPAVPGENLTWTIDIENFGPNTATGVELTDTLPSAATFVSASAAGCTGTTTITCDLADIAAGATATVTIVTSLDASLADGTFLQNAASVSLNEEDAQPANNSTIAGVRVGSEADLSITKSDAADPVAVGDTITYTLTAFNDGPSTATDVRVSDDPDGATTITSIDTAAGTCDLGSRTCEIASLAPGASVVVTVEALVQPSAGGSVTNAAVVTSSVDDDDQSNNRVTEQTTITPVADLTVTKSTTSGTLVAGETVTYSVLVENAGPSAAADVVVTDALDSNLSLISVASPVGTCAGDPTIGCDLGTLGAGAAVDVVITATVGADASGSSIANTATVATTTDQGADTGPNTSTATDVVTNSSDLRIKKEVSSNTLIVGGPFEYTLTVTNDGPSNTDVVATVTDTFPAELTLGAAPAGCSISGQDLTCSVPAGLAVGDSAAFTIDGTVNGGAGTQIANTADVAYPTDPTPGNNSSTSQTQLATEADVRIDKEWTTPTAIAGQTATFTLAVTNDGLSSAANVDVTDTIPNATIVSATSSPTAGACAGSSGGSLACNFVSIANGATETITVEVVIAPDAPTGNLLNSASVSSVTPDRNPGNNSDTDAIDISRQADLTITKAVSDETPVAGETVSYTVEITNAGPSTATASFLGDALPPELSLVAGTISVTGAPNAPVTPCGEAGGIITCDLGELPVSATPVQIAYDVVVDASADPSVGLTNTAVASSTTPDPTPPEVTEVATPVGSADLSVAKSTTATIATPGGDVTYTVRIDNAGPSEARDVELDDVAPSGFTATSATSTQGTCDLTVSCADIGTIAPGGSVEVTITGTLDSGFADATFTNTATVSSSTPDPAGPNTGASTLPVAAEADLAISKIATPTTIAAGGGQVSFDIGVTNAGPSDATGVEVTDILPTGFVVDSISPSQGSCAAFPCDLGTVAAGPTPATITVIGHFPSTQGAGQVVNSVSVTSDVDDPNDASNGVDDNSASATVDVTTAADVTVAKSGPISVVAGEQRIEDPANPGVFTGGVGYTIAVGNDGPSAATGVVLSDVLDASLLDVGSAVLAVTPASACTPTNSGGTVECNIGDLAVGELVTVAITVDVLPDAPAGTANLVNTASVATTTTDPDPADNTSSVATDITQSADLSVVKTKSSNSAIGSPTQFAAGETLTYDLVVTNDGPSTATDVVIGDTPSGPLTLGAVTSVPAGCTMLPCTLSNLDAGESITVTVEATVDSSTNATRVTNTADVTSSTPDGNPVNDESEVTNGVIKRADVELVSKTASPDPAVAGSTITYTITGRNNGPSLAEDVEISDVIPVGVTLLPGSLPIGCSTTGNASGDTVTCDLGDLAAGAGTSRSFDVTVDPDTTAAIVNEATIDTATTQPPGAPDNDSKTITTPVGGAADLGIVKSATPDPAVPGSTLTYTLDITNAGPSTARDVVVADDITGIFDGAVTVTSPGTSCDQAVACDPFDLPVGSTTFTIEGVAAADTTAPIANTATVSSATAEPAGATLPNSSTINTSVAPSADLSITKTANPDPVGPTDPITYTITVTNAGPSDAAAVEIVDTPSSDVTIDTVTSGATGATCVVGTVTCTIPLVEPGVANAVTMTVTATVSDRAVGVIGNTAAVSSATPDPASNNDTVTIGTDVDPEADLQLSKSTVTSPVVAGETVRYEVVVFNNGPAAADDVQVVDTLPAGASFVAASTPVGACVHDGAAAGGELTCDLGSLGDQTSITIQVDMLVDPSTTGNLANSADATTSTPDPDPTNNVDAPAAETNDAVVTAPDLRVRKVLVEPNLVAGSTFDYVIEVFNDGPSTAIADIVVTDTLPSQVDTASVVLSPSPCTFTAATRLVDCAFPGPVAVGASVSVTVSGTILPGATSVDDNTALATTTDDDPNTSNNSGTAVAGLTTNADLVVTKTFDAANVIAGQNTTFTISVINNGPSNADAVELFDDLPTGFSVASLANASGGTCTSTATRVSCLADPLLPGATMSVEVTATASATMAAGPVVNNATATSSTADRNPSNNTDSDDIQVTRLAALTVSKTADPTAASAGEIVTYTIVVTSGGPSSAEATITGDTLPDGLTLIPGSLDPRCTAPSNTVVCDLGDLVPGTATASATITYQARVDADVANGTNIVNSVQASSVTPLVAVATDDSDVDVDTSADVELVSKTVTPDPVVAGTTAGYTITARNNGPSDALMTTVLDDLPATMTPIAASLPIGCTVVSGDVSCDLDTLAAGDTATITFSVTVDAAVADGATLTNNATISSATPDPTPGNEDASAPVGVVAVADVSISKVADPVTAVPGQVLEYTLTVTNDGPSDAQDIVVDDTTLSAFVPGTIVATAPAGTCDATVSCDLGALAPGTTTVTISGTVAAGVTTAIGNTATVSTSTDQGADASPDTVTISTPVAPIADLAIAKTLDTTPPVPGEQVQYTITVTNPGPSSAQDVTLTDSVDGAVTGLVADQAACTFAGNDLTCAIGTLDPGTFAVVVTGDLDEAFVGSLENTAIVTTSTNQGDNDSRDSASVDEVAVADADLSVVKVADQDPVIAGELAQYTITVTNNGPSTALDVVVDDVLPAGLTIDNVTSTQGACTALPCTIGTLADGDTADVVVVAAVGSDVVDLDPNSASVSASTPDSDSSNDTASADPDVDTLARLSILKELDVSPAVSGTTISWTITVGSAGPSDALDVTVFDDVPAFLTDIVVSSTSGGCTALPCVIGTMTPGTFEAVTVSGTLPSNVPIGTLENTASVTSTTVDDEPADDISIASDPIATSADLGIVKTGPAGNVVAGTPVAWTLVVTNDGPSDALAIEVTDTLPAALDESTIVIGDGGSSCVLTGLDLVCEQALLSAGDTLTITIDGTLRTDFTSPALDNEASVSADTDDPDTTNNSDSTTNVNAPRADIVVTGSATPGDVAAGGEVSFEFDIVNDGPSAADNTIITIPIPASIALDGTPTLVGAPPGATVSIVGGQIIVDLGDLPPGTPVQLTFTATVSPDQPLGPLLISATGTTDTSQDDTDDDVAAVTLNIISDVDLSIVKTSDLDEVAFGDEITFTITITNDGTSTATGVTIEDTLPAGLVGVSATGGGGCAFDLDNTIMFCEPTTVAANGGTSLVTVVARAIGNGDYTNVASVEFDGGDAPIASDPVEFEVFRTSDLGITKSVDRADVTINESVTYSIGVTNGGPDTALGVRVLEPLPSGLQYTSHVASVGVYDPATGVWTIGDVTVGATPSLQIVAVAATAGQLTNTATIESEVRDSSGGNTDAVTINVIQPIIPATGRDSQRSVPIGLGLIGAGAVMLLFARRRRVANAA